jgi:ferredoxin
MKRVTHNRKKCIGCAYCVEIAPAFWQMNVEDGKCDLIGSKYENQNSVLEIFDEDLALNCRAADICPTNCIKIQ